MKRVFQIALLGVLSMGAVTVQAQNNWHGDRDERNRSAYVDNNRRQQYSGERDNDRRDDRYPGGAVTATPIAVTRHIVIPATRQLANIITIGKELEGRSLGLVP